MNRTQMIAVALVAALAALVVVLALRSRQAPMLPADADHARFIDTATCMSCHGPESKNPQSTTHPIGNECLRCHGLR